MVCQIIRNFSDEVIRVTTPQGVDSTLYKEALAITKDEEEALNVWATAYTDTFKKAYGEWENEPNISTVMEFINFDSKDRQLTPLEMTEILDAARNFGIQPEELYSNLRNTFFNSKGQFVVDEKAL